MIDNTTTEQEKLWGLIVKEDSSGKEEVKDSKGSKRGRSPVNAEKFGVGMGNSCLWNAFWDERTKEVAH